MIFLLLVKTVLAFLSRGRALLACMAQRQTAHLQAALLHLVWGAGPDTNRSAGLHSFVVFTAGGETQG